MARIQIVYYSMYGHVNALSEKIAEGAKGVNGADVHIGRVPDLMDEETLKRVGAWDAQQEFAGVPVIEPDALAEADAIIVGTPTRFGNMAAQMRNFWDRTGSLWQQGKLIGKLGAAFVGIGTQHGGHETTITSIWHTFAHHGMVIVPLGYGEQRILTMEEITGGSPYGASTMSNTDGSRMPSENELEIAKSQGKQVAELAVRLFG